MLPADIIAAISNVVALNLEVPHPRQIEIASAI
jgi:hypothetical protein